MRKFYPESIVTSIETDASEPQGENWTMAWGDLMMVMFVLFAVLFVYSDSRKDIHVLFSPETAEKARTTSALDPLLELVENLTGLPSKDADTSFAEPGYEVIYRSSDDAVSVIREGDAVRVTMRGGVFFAPNSAKLEQNSEAYLHEIGEVVQRMSGNILVVGYTDSSEAEGAESFVLSAKRAQAVAELLMNRYSLPPSRIAVSGRGAYAPDVPALNGHSREMNRRVEVILMTR